MIHFKGLYLYSFLAKFRNKFPRNFRKISFKVQNILNYLIFFIFLPSKIYFERKIKFNQLKNSFINKVIIRNDKLGDCALTLPFIYGTLGKNKNLFYVSEISKEIIDQLKIKCIWKSSKYSNNNKDLIVANLSTSEINSFKRDLPSKTKPIIFTQFSTEPFSKNGFPIIFSPNYLKNKSQTLFVRSSFNMLGIKSDPIKGIKLLNSNLFKIIGGKKNNILVIVVGLGIDIGRQLSTNNINEIIKFAKERDLKPVILEEPGHEKRLKRLAQEKNIESRSCKNFLELFTLFKISRYAVGYDCGPMHIASLLTNSIILFSHTPSFHWGRHIWHKFIFKRTLTNKSSSIIITKQLNLGSLKYNWIIFSDQKGCPLHKKTCNDNRCSELNKDLLKKSIEFVLKNQKN